MPSARAAREIVRIFLSGTLRLRGLLVSTRVAEEGECLGACALRPFRRGRGRPHRVDLGSGTGLVALPPVWADLLEDARGLLQPGRQVGCLAVVRVEIGHESEIRSTANGHSAQSPAGAGIDTRSTKTSRARVGSRLRRSSAI